MNKENSISNKIFNSPDTKHQIQIDIIYDISWFNINKFDFEFYKTFLLLLRDVLLFMYKNNIRYIKQYINEEDKQYFKKSSIVEINKDLLVVSTNITDFLDEIINVLGIKKM